MIQRDRYIGSMEQCKNRDTMELVSYSSVILLSHVYKLVVKLITKQIDSYQLREAIVGTTIFKN